MDQSDGDNYTISDSYLSAVQEVVDWARDCGLYVILNLHYDGGWLANFPTDKENCMEKYKRIWTQVSDAFADYDDYLIFESQNEELGWESLWNRWGGTEGKAESYALVNEINQTFVDIIRSSGGNNPQRHLLISGYNTDVELTCDSLFQMPDDPAHRCAVSVHYYTPSGFAILEEDADWGKMRSTWGTDADFEELNRNMDLLKPPMWTRESRSSSESTAARKRTRKRSPSGSSCPLSAAQHMSGICVRCCGISQTCTTTGTTARCMMTR